MKLEYFNENHFPFNEMGKIGLVDDDKILLEPKDLAAMMEGRRTSMIRLRNLSVDGIKLEELDVKLSLKLNDNGKVSLMLHPIYKEAVRPYYLTTDEAEKLEKGELVNIQKTSMEDGFKKEILVEYDQDTSEFIISDTELIFIPDFVNNEKLTDSQKERLRKGKEVELADGTTFQYSGTNGEGITSNKLSLIASILIDGGLSYVLFKGLKAAFGKKQEPDAEIFSKGYDQALEDMKKQEKESKTMNQHLDLNEQSRGYGRKASH
jgi:hypothetical protein